MAEQNTLEGFNSKGARVALTGALRTAPLGTAPVPIVEKYDANVHRNLGYLSPDGVELAFDEDKNEFIPWQEASSIRDDIIKAAKTIKATLWESSIENLAMFLGVPLDAIDTDTDGNVTFWEDSLPEFEREQLILDMVDKDKHKRATFPEAQITARDSLVMKKDDMFGLGVTWTIYPANPTDYQSIPAAVGKTTHWQFNKNWVEGGAISSGTDGVTELTVQTSTLPAGAEGAAYEVALAARGGTAPYTWSATGLPAGLSVEGNQITGTPTEAGDFTVDLSVEDAQDLLAVRRLTLTVTEDAEGNG